MITRRTFNLGLTAALLAPAARADVRADGRSVFDKMAPDPRSLPYVPIDQIPNHRKLMREIVGTLSAYGRQRSKSCIILARNAPELLIKGRREWDMESGRDPEGAAYGKYPPVGATDRPYLAAIDGFLGDGMFFGNDEFDKPSPEADAAPLRDASRAAVKQGKPGFDIEYCKSPQIVAQALRHCRDFHAVPFVCTQEDGTLGLIPASHPVDENADHITAIGQARNFLPMEDSSRFPRRQDWVNALAETNYDLLILDAFWQDREPLTAADVTALKMKKLGTRRLVLGILPIGRAHEGSFYWKADWEVGNPSWLAAADPDDPSSVIVEYWNPAWKAIIGQYMKGLLDLGFDGVLLDELDSYLYFEALTPLK